MRSCRSTDFWRPNPLRRQLPGKVQREGLPRRRGRAPLLLTRRRRRAAPPARACPEGRGSWRREARPWGLGLTPPGVGAGPDGVARGRRSQSHRRATEVVPNRLRAGLLARVVAPDAPRLSHAPGTVRIPIRHRGRLAIDLGPASDRVEDLGGGPLDSVPADPSRPGCIARCAQQVPSRRSARGPGRTSARCWRAQSALQLGRCTAVIRRARSSTSSYASFAGSAATA